MQPETARGSLLGKVNSRCTGKRLETSPAGVHPIQHHAAASSAASLESALPQKTPQHIHKDECPKITDVAVVVNRRAAGVHANEVVLQRLEVLDAAGKRIKKTRHRCVGNFRL